MLTQVIGNGEETTDIIAFKCARENQLKTGGIGYYRRRCEDFNLESLRHDKASTQSEIRRSNIKHLVDQCDGVLIFEHIWCTTVILARQYSQVRLINLGLGTTLKSKEVYRPCWRIGLDTRDETAVVEIRKFISQHNIGVLYVCGCHNPGREQEERIGNILGTVFKVHKER